MPSHARRRKISKADDGDLPEQHADIKVHVVTTYDGKAAVVPHVDTSGKVVASGLAPAPATGPAVPSPARHRLNKLLSDEGVDPTDREAVAAAAKKIHGTAPGDVTRGDVEAAAAALHHGPCEHQGYLLKLKKAHTLDATAAWKKRYFIVRDGFLLHYVKAEDLAPTGWIKLSAVRKVKLVADGTVLPGTSEPVKHCFEVTLQSHSLVLRAASADSAREWMQTLFTSRGMRRVGTKPRFSPRHAAPKRTFSDGKGDEGGAGDDGGKDGGAEAPDAGAGDSASGGGDDRPASPGPPMEVGPDAVSTPSGEDIWDEFHDADTDKHYWINRRTAEMSWAPPEHSAHGDDGAVGGMEWIIKWDADGKAHYYYRPADGTSQDTHPEAGADHYGAHVDAHKDLTVHGGEGKASESYGDADSSAFESVGASTSFDVTAGGAGGAGAVAEASATSPKMDVEHDIPGVLSHTWQQNARRQARRRSVVLEMQKERAYREQHRAEEEAREHAVKLEKEVRALRDALKSMKKKADRARLIAELDEEHRRAIGLAEEHADDHDKLIEVFTKLAIKVDDKHTEKARVREQWFEQWSVEWSQPYYVSAATNESQWDVPEGPNIEIVQFSEVDGFDA